MAKKIKQSEPRNWKDAANILKNSKANRKKSLGLGDRMAEIEKMLKEKKDVRS